MIIREEYSNDGDTIFYDDDADCLVRYVVWQDTDAERPTSWDDSNEVMIYRTRPHGPTDAPISELARVFQRVFNVDHEDTLALEVTRRYARVFLGWDKDRASESIVTYGAQGYSQSDWWEVLAITHEGSYADSLAQEWEQWARGDVWGVTSEYGHECDAGEIHWDNTTHEGDSCGGIFANSVEDALEHFLTIT